MLLYAKGKLATASQDTLINIFCAGERTFARKMRGSSCIWMRIPQDPRFPESRDKPLLKGSSTKANMKHDEPVPQHESPIIKQEQDILA